MSNRHEFLQMRAQESEQERREDRKQHIQQLLYLEHEKNKINSDGRKEINRDNSIQSRQSEQS